MPKYDAAYYTRDLEERYDEWLGIETDSLANAMRLAAEHIHRLEDNMHIRSVLVEEVEQCDDNS